MKKAKKILMFLFIFVILLIYSPCSTDVNASDRFFSQENTEKKIDKSVKYSSRIFGKECFLMLVPAPDINDPIGIPAPEIHDSIGIPEQEMYDSIYDK